MPVQIAKADPTMSIVVENVSFISEGFRLLGRIHRPNTSGQYPGAAICLGYPGDTKHTDMAEELAFNGMVALVFYYRGAWGSEGAFSFRALEPSARDAVEFLRSQPFVDRSRVGLIGHSMGALPLSRRLSVDRRLKAGALISPVADISSWAFDEVRDRIVPNWMRMGEGKLSGLNPDLIKSELPWLVENMNPIETIKEVKAPILVIAGTNDQITFPELCRALYDESNEPKRWHLIEGADHTFSEHRILLIREVLNWLKNNL